jgi:hypothetical protein
MSTTMTPAYKGGHMHAMARGFKENFAFGQRIFLLCAFFGHSCERTPPVSGVRSGRYDAIGYQFAGFS